MKLAKRIAALLLALLLISSLTACGKKDKKDSEETDSSSASASASGASASVAAPAVKETAATFAEAIGGNLGESSDSGSSSASAPDAEVLSGAWFGWLRLRVDTDTAFDAAWAYVKEDSKGNQYFEVFRDGYPDTAFVSMYCTTEENDTRLVPVIGDKDAWVWDIYLNASDEEYFNKSISADGSFTFTYEYVDENRYACRVELFIRKDGVPWNEASDTLPPRYEEYKANLAGAGSSSSSSGSGGSNSASGGPACEMAGENYKPLGSGPNLEDMKTFFRWYFREASIADRDNLTYDDVVEALKSDPTEIFKDGESLVCIWRPEHNTQGTQIRFDFKTFNGTTWVDGWGQSSSLPLGFCARPRRLTAKRNTLWRFP